MRVELANLYDRLGTTMIYVTHDQIEAMTMATRIVVLNNGYVEQVGTPFELYNFPRNRFVASFIGSPKMNMLAARVEGTRAEIADFGALPLDGPSVAAGDISVGVRPEQITIGDTGDATADGTITLVEYLGSGIFLYVRLASGQIVLVQAPGQAQHKIGEVVRVSISAGNAHYFDDAGLRLPLNAAVSPRRPPGTMATPARLSLHGNAAVGSRTMQNKPKQQRATGGKPADEAEFLVEEFDLTEREASELVTEDDDAAAQARAAVQKKRDQRTPLKEAPVPETPDSDFTADSDEERLKPVARTSNDRRGGG